MDLDRLARHLNPILIRLLHSPLHGVASRGLMTLRYRGRRTGREITLPVGYQRHRDGHIDVLVSKAPRKRWWRNFAEPGPVELCVRGERLRGTARLVPAEDPAFVEAFAETFRRLPFLPGQFDVADWETGTPPSTEQLARLRAAGRLVRIDGLSSGLSSEPSD